MDTSTEQHSQEGELEDKDMKEAQQEEEDNSLEKAIIPCTTEHHLDPIGYYTFYNKTIRDRQCLRNIVEMLDEDTCRYVLTSIIEATGPVFHHLTSYSRFIHHYLPNIVKENERTISDSHVTKRRFVLELSPPYYGEPVNREEKVTRDVYSSECRIRNLSYVCPVFVDVRYTCYDLSIYDKDNPAPPPLPTADFSSMRVCETKLWRETPLLYLPVMYMSELCRMRSSPSLNNECPLIVPGFFIINGSEKVVIPQEKMRNNYPCVYPDKQDSRYSHILEMRCGHENKMRSTSNISLYIGRTTPTIVCEVAFLKCYMTITVLFHLLRVQKVEDMLQMIMENHSRGDDERRRIRRLASAILESDWQEETASMSFSDLCEYLGKEGTTESTSEKRIKYIEHIVSNELFPHVGTERDPDTYFRKALYLSSCAYRLIAGKLGIIPPDQKDNKANKSVMLVGELLGVLIRREMATNFKGAATLMKRMGDYGKPINISEAINCRSLSAKIRTALSTGNWTPKKGASSSTGIAQMHNRMTRSAELSNLRRVAMAVNKEAKNPKARQLRYTDVGIYCAGETPEGQQCGLIKNLALLTRIRVGYDTESIWKMIELGIDPELLVLIHRTTSEQRSKMVLLSVNGRPVAYVEPDKCNQIVDSLREIRRIGGMPQDCSIVYRPMIRSLHVHGHAGCVMWPLFRIAGLHHLKRLLALYSAQPTTLLDELALWGVIEWISKDEEETLRVAFSPKDLISDDLNPVDDVEPFTHVIIHPTAINGATLSLIPHAEHNQAPRNMYQTAMGKQCTSFQSLNLAHRTDTVSYALCYPEVPLVQTMMEGTLHCDKLPSGQNVIISIMCFDGGNQEDAFYMSQAAIDRGLFRYFLKHTFRDEEKPKGPEPSSIEVPDPAKCEVMRTGNASKLNPLTGYVDAGAWVEPNDLLIGKVTSTEPISDPEMPRPTQVHPVTGKPIKTVQIDNSTVLRTNEPGLVERTIETVNKDGAKLVKIILRSIRATELGDKASSRHGQKGTSGVIKRQEDMPFYNRVIVMPDGKVRFKAIQPDIIINPHAIPSRMTIGMMIECIQGKACCFTGEIGDGTSFNDEVTIESIQQELARRGINPSGRELMYDPYTGLPMESLVFTAPCNYQKLKHNASDKIHGRGRGPVQILTRQPVEGRARDGGFRFGEMERDCLIAHGVTFVMKDRLHEQSDPYETALCTGCGFLCQPPKPDGEMGGLSIHSRGAWCRVCSSHEKVRMIKLPHAFKLWWQELFAMGMAMRIHVREGESGALDMVGTEPVHLRRVHRVCDFDKNVHAGDNNKGRCGESGSEERGEFLNGVEWPVRLN